MEIMDASIVGLITSAVCIFLLWKFLSCAVFPLLGSFYTVKRIRWHHCRGLLTPTSEYIQNECGRK